VIYDFKYLPFSSFCQNECDKITKMLESIDAERLAFLFRRSSKSLQVSLSCYKFDSNRQPSWTLWLSHLKDIACNGIIINWHYWIFSTICCTIRYSPISSSSWITMWWSSVIRACWPRIRSTFEFYFSIYRANIRHRAQRYQNFKNDTDSAIYVSR